MDTKLMKKLRHKLLPIGLSGAFLALTPGLAAASVDAYVTQGDSAAQTYLYQMSDLEDSLGASLIDSTDPAALLWNHFVANKKSILSLHDDAQGYIKYSDVEDAYEDALINGTQFSVDVYTESDAAAKATDLPAFVKGITLVDGAIVDEDIATGEEDEATVTAVSAINVTTEAGTAPVLPATGTATMSDGTTKSVDITWAAVDADSYAVVGSFTVSGTIAESATVTATATVEVTAAQNITVQSANVVNATNITVTFSNGDVKSFTVPEMVVGENTPTINYLGVDYPVAVTCTVQDIAYIELTPSVDSIDVNPSGATDPVLITAKLKGFPDGVEATIDFSSTYGQIDKVETTTDGEVVVKLYPSEDSEEVTAHITAKVSVAKNPATGQLYEAYQNVKIAETQVIFKPQSGDVQDGKLYSLSSALTDQADRVFINLNQDLTEEALAYIVANPGIFDVFDNQQNLIAVSAVQKKDADTLILILDRSDVNFPLTDNVKHSIEINDNNNASIKFSGNATFILEDATYVKMMKIYTSTSKPSDNPVPVAQNQLLVVFNEAVNDDLEIESAQGWLYSAHNPKNWVIDGLNLSTDTDQAVTFETFSVKTDTTEREAVVLTFNSIVDLNEFMSTGTHKLQVNTLGDWASVTDKVNMVATQELQYEGITFDNVTVDWVIDGDYDYDIDGEDESPEQFIVNFSAPVSGGTFEIIVPNNDNLNPYEDEFITLTEKDFADGANTDGFSVTQLDAIGQKYLIEMNQDWTKLYDTEGTKRNYHINQINPIRLVVKGWVDVIGRSVEDVVASNAKVATHDLTLVEDTQSPYTTEKTQLTKIIGTNEIGEVFRDAGTVRIVMNEPVQYNDQDLDVKIFPGETASQQQDGDGGVDVATFEYIKLKDAAGVAVSQNITVEGEIVDLDNTAYEADRDYGVIVEPVEELTTGTWKLVIRAISDDVGNTMKTETMPIEITANTVIPTDSLYIVGVDAHHDIVIDGEDDDNIIGVQADWLADRLYAKDLDDTDDAADIIHVLFNQDMLLTGDNSVLNKGNYRLNGVALPVDGTEIVRGIRGENGMETSKKGVTIILPDGYLQERDDNHTLTIMNVADGLQKFDMINDRIQLPYKAELHDGGVVDPAIAAATAAVVTAEASKTQADIDAALVLINALPDSDAKTALLDRANAIVVVDAKTAEGTVQLANIGSAVVARVTVASAEVGTQVSYNGTTKAFGEVLQFTATGLTSVEISLLNAAGQQVGTMTVNLTAGEFESVITEVEAPVSKATGSVQLANIGSAVIARVTVDSADVGTQVSYNGTTKAFGEVLQFTATGLTSVDIDVLLADGSTVGTITVPLTAGDFDVTVD